MRVIYCVYTNWFGESQFFFDINGNLLHWFACNDAHYRHEYMNPLMAKLGIKVEAAQQDDPRFRLSIQNELRQHGATDEDFTDG